MRLILKTPRQSPSPAVAELVPGVWLPVLKMIGIVRDDLLFADHWFIAVRRSGVRFTITNEGDRNV